VIGTNAMRTPARAAEASTTGRRRSRAPWRTLQWWGHASGLRAPRRLPVLERVRGVGLALGVLVWSRYLLFAAAGTVFVVRMIGKMVPDWFLFEMAARIMLRGPGRYQFEGNRWHLYEQMPRLQFGPPSVLAVMPLQLLPIRLSHILAYSLLMAIGLVCLAIMERIAFEQGVPYVPRASTVLLGGVGLCYEWKILAVDWLHIDDVLALLLILLSVWALSRSRQHWVLAAVLLGTAGAAKPWVAVCWPMLLQVPRARQAIAALLCLVSGVVWWLPFQIADPRTFGAVGSVRVLEARDSCLRLFGLVVDGYSPPGHRMVQLALGILVTGWVVHRSRRWDVALLAALMVRVATDTQTWPYYAAGPVMAALLIDLRRARRWPWLTGIVFGVESLLPLMHAPWWSVAGVRLALAVAVVAVALRKNPGDDGPSTRQGGTTLEEAGTTATSAALTPGRA
jgi:hypothetical protein